MRITASPWISFLVCQNLDAHLFARLKRRYKESVLLRSIVSDVLNLTLDSMIFVTLAFSGIMPVAPLIIGRVFTKNLIGSMDTLWFICYRKLLRKLE